MKKIFLALLILLSLAITCLLVIWFNLGLIINEKNLEYAKNKFNLPLSWSTLNVGIKNISAMEKQFDLHTENFCFEWESPKIQVCFAHLKSSAKIRVFLKSPYIQLRDFLLEGETSVANIVLLPSSEEMPAPTQEVFWPDLRAPSLADLLNNYLAYLDKSTLQSIDLKVPQARIQKEDLLIELKARLLYQDNIVTLEAQTDIKKTQASYLNAEVKSSLRLSDPLLELSLKARSPEFNSSAEATLKWQKDINLDVLFESKKILPVSGRLKLKNTPRSWKLDIQSEAHLKKWNMGRAQVKNCLIAADLEENGTLKQLNLPCDFELMGVEKLAHRFLPSTLHIHLDSKNSFALKNNDLQIGSALDIQSGDNTLIDIDINGKSDMQINLLTYEINRVSIPSFEALVKIEKVKSWHEIFKKNNVPLPAPLNALDGPLELRSKVQSPDLKLITSQTTLTTQLEGKGQKLITASNANLDVDLNSHNITLEGDVILKEIAVDLPYIGLEAPPQIAPDSRFKGLPAKEKSKPGLWKFNIKRFAIKTPEKPIIIRTRLLGEEIPLRVNYTFAGPSFAGHVGLDPFGVELFNKRFKISKFKVIKHDHSDVMDLDGELNYSNSEVKVSILVIGTTTAPKIEFLSDPALSREQIISVILFNKSLQQLTNEDRLVAGQMNQALMADAFGIFSLLFLSKTPIESIYYDPVSKSYTARVKLDDQTSLSLGSNFDTSQQFQLRRRLGGPWSVVTELQKSQNADDTITTLIEWFKRF